jgi:diaminohydroxyphosphoribosylaminopyrimidine deaminase / 5-amino-6-(5-phosphoribosylamino)uracil reductase
LQQPTAAVDEVTREWTQVDRRLLSRALELAAQGKGQVSPGPLVGCVIADPNGEIIGEGFYVYEKLKHAETYALEQAGPRVKGSTAYVSLEPHAHHGRTPPCTDALITAGVRRVVVPVEDPNPKVSGQGFGHLRSAGIEVLTGLMAEEAERLNEKYFHYMRTQRPFVHLKMAVSLDGKIATRTGDSRWITGPEARLRAHELRHEYDAIMVGAGTASADNPLLTDRSGKVRRRPLVRVILDEALRLSPESQLVTTAKQAPVIVFASDTENYAKLQQMETCGVEVIQEGEGGRELEAVMTELGNRSVQSVLVEGGASVAGRLLDAGLVNKVTFFIAPILIGGRNAPTAIAGEGAETLASAFDLAEVEVNQHGRDIEVTGYPRKREQR